MEVFVFAIGLFVILFIILVALLLPKVRRWRKKNWELAALSKRIGELEKLRNEITFHLSWARERGENTKDFQYDLQKVNEELGELANRYDEIELLDIRKP